MHQNQYGIAQQPGDRWAGSKHIPCHRAFASKTPKDKTGNIHANRHSTTFKFKKPGRANKRRNFTETSQAFTSDKTLMEKNQGMLRKELLYVPYAVRGIQTRHRCPMGQWWHPAESSLTSTSPSGVCTNQWRDSPTLVEVRKWNDSWWFDDHARMIKDVWTVLAPIPPWNNHGSGRRVPANQHVQGTAWRHSPKQRPMFHQFRPHMWPNSAGYHRPGQDLDLLLTLVQFEQTYVISISKFSREIVTLPQFRSMSMCIISMWHM